MRGKQSGKYISSGSEIYCPTCNIIVENLEDIIQHTYKGGKPYQVHLKCGYIPQLRKKGFKEPKPLEPLKPKDPPKPDIEPEDDEYYEDARITEIFEEPRRKKGLEIFF